MNNKKQLEELTKLLESHPVKIDRLISIEAIENPVSQDFLKKVIFHNQELKLKLIKPQMSLSKSV